MFAEAADIVHSFSYVLISMSKMKIKLFLLLSLLSLAKVWIQLSGQSLNLFERNPAATPSTIPCMSVQNICDILFSFLRTWWQPSCISDCCVRWEQSSMWRLVSTTSVCVPTASSMSPPVDLSVSSLHCRFVVEQLYPTWQYFGHEMITVDFKPFGKANVISLYAEASSVEALSVSRSL